MKNGRTKFSFFGNGGTKFQPVYVGDVADAISTCLSLKHAMGRIFELGGPKIYTFKEIIELVLRITNRKRLIIPVPLKVAMIQGYFLQAFPKPLLTSDQVKLLKFDNVVKSGSFGFRDLGLEPLTPEIILPKYLKRFSNKHY